MLSPWTHRITRSRVCSMLWSYVIPANVQKPSLGWGKQVSPPI
jgi:hypothetical protein